MSEDVIKRLRSDDVALKLTHGEGEGYYAVMGGELHHHRAHHRAESAEPGEEARERFEIDAQFLTLFNPEFIPLKDAPFDRSVDTKTDGQEADS